MAAGHRPRATSDQQVYVVAFFSQLLLRCAHWRRQAAKLSGCDQVLGFQGEIMAGKNRF